MANEALKLYNESRQLRAEGDRTFQLDDVTLVYRPAVAASVALRFQDVTLALGRWGEEVNRLLESANGDAVVEPELPYTERELIETYNDTVLACLAPESHEAWAQLCSTATANPFSGEDIYRLAVLLLGEVTNLPTDGLLGSSTTQPEILTTSKESSPSQARKRKTSAPS